MRVVVFLGCVNLGEEIIEQAWASRVFLSKMLRFQTLEGIARIRNGFSLSFFLSYPHDLHWDFKNILFFRVPSNPSVFLENVLIWITPFLVFHGHVVINKRKENVSSDGPSGVGRGLCVLLCLHAWSFHRYPRFGKILTGNNPRLLQLRFVEAAVGISS